MLNLITNASGNLQVKVHIDRLGASSFIELFNDSSFNPITGT